MVSCSHTAGRRQELSERGQEGRVQRLEALLREHADGMAEAERIARFGVWRWDVATGRVTWSAHLHSIYGIQPGEFEGTVEGFVGRLHPDDRERIGEHIAHAVETLEPFAFEERIVRPDGSIRVLISQGRAISGPDGHTATLVGVCHDVTERAAAEHALGTSERRMRAILDNSPSAVAVKDLDGRYRMCNAECGRVLGVAADDLIGHDCHEHLDDELADRLRANDQLAAALGEPVYEDMTLVREGEPRRYMMITFALPDASGHPVETCTIGTDVTERKELEDVRLQREAWQERIESAIDEGRLLAYEQPIIELAAQGRDEQRCELLVRLREDGDVLPAARVPAGRRALRAHPRDRRLDGAPGDRAGGHARAGGQPVGDLAVRHGRARPRSSSCCRRHRRRRGGSSSRSPRRRLPSTWTRRARSPRR